MLPYIILFEPMRTRPENIIPLSQMGMTPQSSDLDSSISTTPELGTKIVLP